MKFEVLEISVEFAKEVLESRNPANRVLNGTRVATYATAMRNNEWRVTHQGLCFDETGKLIDGQHRLAAVIEYGLPVRMMVCTDCQRIETTVGGVDVDVMDVSDAGQARTMGQRLRLAHGVQNANNVAAIVMVLRAIARPGSYGTAISVSQVLKVREIYGESMERVLAVRWQPGDKKAGILAAFTAYHAAYPDNALDFMRAATEMANLDAKSPILAWRKWVMSSTQKGIGTRFDRLAGCYVTALACEKHRRGEEVSLLRATPDAIVRLLAANKEKNQGLVLASQE